MPLKKRIYNILSVPGTVGSMAWLVDVFIITLIILNVVAIILESVSPIFLAYGEFLYYFEIFSVSVFTVEYLLRLWVANEDPNYNTPVWGNIKYAFTPLAIIDLLAILPFFLPFLGVDLRQLRILRLFRLLRILKLARYVNAMALIRQTVVNKKEELLISLAFTLLMLLIASSLMYYAENQIQPDVFSSIPATMWWGIATLTTVGYGDVYPITTIGQVLGGIIAIIGIGLFALPAGILASSFSEVISKKVNDSNACPHCGKNHNEPEIL